MLLSASCQTDVAYYATLNAPISVYASLHLVTYLCCFVATLALWLDGVDSMVIIVIIICQIYYDSLVRRRRRASGRRWTRAGGEDFKKFTVINVNNY